MSSSSAGNSSEIQSPIQLTFINDTAYCFDVDDYMKIRVDYHIPGKLVGCCPKWPSNSNLVGLPAIFNPYEVRLLVTKGYAILVRKDFSKPPSEAVQQQYKNLLETNQEFLIDFCRENKVGESKKIIQKIVEGKRKKCKAKGLNPDDITEESVLNEIRENFQFNPQNNLIQIPTKEPFDADITVVFDLPEVDPLTYRVFLHFWEKSNWITLGERFGADLLIYPGEPMYFHASHLIHVIVNVENRQIPVTELIAKGRVSVIVNKHCVFAFEDPVTNELCFQTLKWEGKSGAMNRKTNAR